MNKPDQYATPSTRFQCGDQLALTQMAFGRGAVATPAVAQDFLALTERLSGHTR